jgi:hypothetical protein
MLKIDLGLLQAVIQERCFWLEEQIVDASLVQLVFRLHGETDFW